LNVLYRSESVNRLNHVRRDKTDNPYDKILIFILYFKKDSIAKIDLISQINEIDYE